MALKKEKLTFPKSGTHVFSYNEEEIRAILLDHFFVACKELLSDNTEAKVEFKQNDDSKNLAAEIYLR